MDSLGIPQKRYGAYMSPHMLIRLIKKNLADQPFTKVDQETVIYKLKCPPPIPRSSAFSFFAVRRSCRRSVQACLANLQRRGMENMNDDLFGSFNPC